MIRAGSVGWFRDDCVWLPSQFIVVTAIWLPSFGDYEDLVAAQ